MITYADLKTAAPALQKIAEAELPLPYALILADLIDRFNEEVSNLDNVSDKDAALKGYRRIVFPAELPLMISAADVKRLEPLIVFRKGAETFV